MQTLEALVAAPGGGPLEPHQAAGWLLRLAKTLDALHLQGRAHGGLCAAAILAEERSPFGAGKLLAADGQAAFAYRSPERGAAGPASAADDRWAWAVLLFFVTTGRLPDGDRALSALADQPALQTFLQSCFAVELSARPENAAALCTAMERVVGVGSSLAALETVLAPGQSTPTGSSFGGGRLLLVAGGGIALVLFLAFGALKTSALRVNQPTKAPDVPDEVPLPAKTLPVPALSIDAPELRTVPAGQCVERVLGAALPDAQAGLCGSRDALSLLETVRATVKGTPQQKKWDALGWYDLPAVVALQARCCPLVFAPTVDTSPACQAEEALRGVQVVARKKPRAPVDDPELLSATKAFGTAATCASKRFSDTKKAHRATLAPGEEAAFLAFFGELLAPAAGFARRLGLFARGGPGLFLTCAP